MQLAAGALNGLNVLVIVDDFGEVESLVESLRAAGALCRRRPYGAARVGLLERHTIDVILVDLHEPRWWLTPEIRALRSLSRAPMYALTEPDQEMPDASFDIAGYFVKPVRVDALIATLSSLPRRSH